MTFVVDTAGSTIDTVLAVYTGVTLTTLSNIACMKGPGANSSVQFPATLGVPYSVAVDGATPAQQGLIQLNWKLGSYPAILTQPASQFANPGATVNFTVVASGVPAPQYRWRSNGTNIPNATSSTLSLSPVNAGHSGYYSVVVSNFMGTVTSSVVVGVSGQSTRYGHFRATEGEFLAVTCHWPPVTCHYSEVRR